MAIDYTAFSRLSIAETDRRLAYMRKTWPDWFGGVLFVSDARLGRFDKEIGAEFGIEPACTFSLHVLNKDWLDAARDAVEMTYRVFGTKDLVITYGTDSIRAPLADYPPMEIG